MESDSQNFYAIRRPTNFCQAATHRFSLSGVLPEFATLWEDLPNLATRLIILFTVVSDALNEHPVGRLAQLCQAAIYRFSLGAMMPKISNLWKVLPTFTRPLLIIFHCRL